MNTGLPPHLALAERSHNERISDESRRQAEQVARERAMRLLPTTAEEAGQVVADAEAREARAVENARIEDAALKDVKDVVDAASYHVIIAQRALRDAELAREATLQREREDFESGQATTLADVASAEAAVASAQRRVDLLGGKLAEARAPLDSAQTAAQHAHDVVADARVLLARARYVREARVYTQLYLETVTPLLDAYRSAVARCGPGLKPSAAREYRRALEQTTRALAPVLSDDVRLQELPRAPVSAPAAVDQSMVEMVVRPGECYGSSSAGERVSVPEVELKNRSTMSALETVEEYEQRQFEAQAARERPRRVVSALVATVEAGLAKLTEIGAKRAAERADRAKASSDLTKMAAHFAAKLEE